MLADSGYVAYAVTKKGELPLPESLDPRWCAACGSLAAVGRVGSSGPTIEPPSDPPGRRRTGFDIAQGDDQKAWRNRWATLCPTAGVIQPRR